MKYLLFICLIFCSCSKLERNPIGLSENLGTSSFSYSDFSGKFTQKREIKLENGKLISRVKLFSGDKELESTVSVSKVGRGQTKNQKYVLPSVSQFRVWFDKVEYFSQIKVDRKNRELHVNMKSPEKKWNGTKKVNLPRSAQYICFFSQLPECLKIQNLLLKSARKDLSFYVIWDNYPYHVEQFEGVSAEPYFLATLKLDGYSKKIVKYSLDIGNQILSFHFDKNLNYIKMFWVSQGIAAELSQKE